MGGGSGDAGQPSSTEIKVPVCRLWTGKGKATSSSAPRQAEGRHGGVAEPRHGHVPKFQRREPGMVAQRTWSPRRGVPRGVGDGESKSNDVCGDHAPQRGFKTDRWFHVSDGKYQDANADPSNPPRAAGEMNLPKGQPFRASPFYPSLLVQTLDSRFLRAALKQARTRGGWPRSWTTGWRGFSRRWQTRCRGPGWCGAWGGRGSRSPQCRNPTV